MVGNAVFALYLGVLCPQCSLISYKTYLLVEKKRNLIAVFDFIDGQILVVIQCIYNFKISFLTYMSSLLEIVHETLLSRETWVCFETNRT